MGRAPQASSSPTRSAMRATIAAAVRRSRPVAVAWSSVVAQVGADHDEGLGPAPQRLQHAGDLVGVRVAHEQRDDADRAQYALQEGQRHLQGVLIDVRAVAHEHPGEGRARAGATPRPPRRRRAVSRTASAPLTAGRRAAHCAQDPSPPGQGSGRTLEPTFPDGWGAPRSCLARANFGAFCKI